MAYHVCEVFLTHSPLATPSCGAPSETGALVDFWGVVRGTEGGQEIAGIDYEAHPSMAEHQLRMVANEAAKRFELGQITIGHRIGFVPVGEASLLVRVGSSHRAAAFRAIESVVNELKRVAPIWKHPRFRREASPLPNESQSKLAAMHSPR